MIRTLSLWISVWLLLAAPAAMAQHEAEESQKKKLYNSLKSRSAAVEGDQLLREARELKNDQPAAAIARVQDALGLALAQGNEWLEGRSYLLLGEINADRKEWRLAATHYDRAIRALAARHQQTDEYGAAIAGAAHAQVELKNFGTALTLYRQALALETNTIRKSERMLDISEAHYQSGQYADALQAVSSLGESGGDAYPPSLASRIQSQKAKIYARLNQIEKATDLFEASQEAARGAPASAPVQAAKEELSDVYRSQGRLEEDIRLRNRSISQNLEANNLEEVSKDKIALSKSLTDAGANAEALRELESAARLADTVGNPFQQAEAYLALAEFHRHRGQAPPALRNYERYSRAMRQAQLLQNEQIAERTALIAQQKELDEFAQQVILQRQEEQSTLALQQWIILGLALLLVAVSLAAYFIYANARASQRANQLIALRSLRGQMNPHFIFNALNSVNQFIAQRDERSANAFLSEFSRLMRLVLDYSEEDFISLAREEELLALYLKLEHNRFRDKFDYVVEIDPTLDKEGLLLPPMLIQPYLENAVWHGLRYKTEKGLLQLQIARAPGGITVTIRDNGIGRKKSAELKTANQRQHQSTGMRNIQQRIAILNALYQTTLRAAVLDLPSDSGTEVHLFIPSLTPHQQVA